MGKAIVRFGRNVHKLEVIRGLVGSGVGVMAQIWTRKTRIALGWLFFGRKAA